ncbi:hypothetical protein A1D31_39195 [Bradyrhizobium liaoningense]|nr:hypothetical protein A1D31_39195 [Bradyrhizobium liaoningense]
MLDRADKGLSIRRQCELLGVARSGVYRLQKPANDNDLAVMRRIDELFAAWPFLGSRRITAMLKAEGETINRKRVQRLMRQMGIAALGPKPNTSKPAPGHKIHPYLLRNMTIDRPNQVWAADITYLPIGRGFLYLVAIIDWASRAVLAWRLSNTMDTSFCLAALDLWRCRRNPSVPRRWPDRLQLAEERLGVWRRTRGQRCYLRWHQYLLRGVRLYRERTDATGPSGKYVGACLARSCVVRPNPMAVPRVAYRLPPLSLADETPLAQIPLLA